MKSKNIAILMYGGVGGGFFSQGVPILTDFIERIAQTHKVTVYSWLSTNSDFNPKGYKVESVNGRVHSLGVFLAFKIFWRLFKSHRKEKYNLIHCIWGYPAGFWGVLFGKILKIPTIVSLQGGETASLPEINYGNLLNNKVRFLSNWGYKNTNLITTLTNFQKNILLQSLSNNKYKTSIQVVPYGVQEHLISSNNTILQPPYQFLHVANLNKIKQQNILLEVFEQLSHHVSCFLTIVGTGIEENQLKNIAKNLKINHLVNFEGVVAHQNIGNYYQKSHFLLHTSAYEAQAVVLNEALANGVVVVATNVGLASDLAENHINTVAVGDVKAMVEKVLYLIKNVEKYKIYQNKGYKYSQKYTAEWTKRQFENFYEQIGN
jgi:glycosyltransferase involved in cell wall biosynthesis